MTLTLFAVCSPAMYQASTAMVVPYSTSIRFHLMDVPPAFASGAAMQSASCHMAKMTTVDLLKDGERAGFCLGSDGTSKHVYFVPPMHSVRFVATAKNDSPTALHLHSTKEDDVSAFNLKSQLAPGTAHILLRKMYSGCFQPGIGFCLMTSLDIVGPW